MTNEAMKEKLVAVANLLADLTGAVAEIAAEFGEVKKVEPETAAPAAEEKKEEPKAEAPKAEVKKYTMEDVRKALAEKSGAGFTDQVRELLQKHGASRLSGIKEEEYDLLEGRSYT